MALQRNVVYTVTRWMDEWLDWWMHEWMLLKLTEAHHGGLEQELDACLITVAFFFCVCESHVRKRWRLFVFFNFCPVVLEKRRGYWKTPCRHEDSPVLFCHFFPLFSFWDSLFKSPSFPPPHALWSHFKSCWYDTTSFFLLFLLSFIKLQTVWWREETKTKMMSEWKLVLRLVFTHISVRSLHPLQASLNDFQLIQFILRLWKDTVSVQRGQRRSQRPAKNTNV